MSNEGMFKAGRGEEEEEEGGREGRREERGGEGRGEERRGEERIHNKGRFVPGPC